MKSVASGSRSSTAAATAAGSVESRTRRSQPVLGRAEGPGEDVGGEAAAAHPGDDRRREAVITDPLAEPFERADAVREVLRGVEPAEALHDGGLDAFVARPERRVLREQALHPALVASPGDGVVVGRGTGAEREGREAGRRGGSGVGHVGSMVVQRPVRALAGQRPQIGGRCHPPDAASTTRAAASATSSRQARATS